MLGAGRQGRTIARFLWEDGYKVGVVDLNENNLELVRVACPGINAFKLNPLEEDKAKVLNLLRRYVVLIDALPARLGLKTIKLIIEAGRHGVSISFLEEDYMKLHPLAERANIMIVPDCGVAPGLSNLFAGWAVRKLPEGERLTIKVGGLPKRPLPPFYHNITWSVEDMLEEYLRPARVKIGGQVKEVPPFSAIREEKDLPIARLASFPSDGLRSLLYTLPVQNMEERTLRYQSHLEKMKVLKELGFFSENQIEFFFGAFPIKILTSKILESNFSHLPKEDILILRVELHSSGKAILFDLFDEYDPVTGLTAMTRTTSVAAYIFAKAILERKIMGRGVLPPERFANNERFFGYVINELRKKKIRISERPL